MAVFTKLNKNEMDIRKISIGADYKSGAMHYIVGQDVLGGSHTIHLIQATEGSYKIWIQKENRAERRNTR